MLSAIIGFIGALVGVIGWFGFKSVIALVIGFATYIAETALEWKNLNSGAIGFEIGVVVVGCIVGFFVKSIPFYVMGLIFINIYSLLMGLLSIPTLFRR